MTVLKFRRSFLSAAVSYYPVSSVALAGSVLLAAICASSMPVWAGSGLNTATGLDVSPNSVTAGIVLVLKATVAHQNRSPVRAGQVVFCDATAVDCEDAAVLGTAQLSRTGTAAVNLRLGVGNYSVKAVFVGTNADAGSVSQPQSLTVTGQVSTTTALKVSGTVGNYTLAAAVTGSGRAAPTGPVTFEDSSNGNATVATVTLDPKTAVLEFPLSNYNVGNGAYAVAAGDFNGDGTPDIVVANVQDSTVSVLLGVGDGTFHTQVTYATGSSPRAVAIGDFNSDGKLDLVVANSNDVGNGTLSVLLGNGDGTFQPQQTILLSNNPLSVAIGDFNNDGKPDIAVAAGFSAPEVNILLGNGDGTFQAQQTYAVGGTPIEIAIGDFNRDGKLDLVVANPFNNMVSVLLGNGDGTLQPPTTYAAGNLSGSVAIGDFNGDGKPDLAVANHGDNNVSVLLGNGDGTFQTQQTYAASNLAGAVAVGDFNGDGKLDLVVTSSILGINSILSVLLGNGDGTFQTKQTYAVGNDPYSLVVADFNGDGQPDVAFSNFGVGSPNTVSVLLNQWSVQGTTSAMAVPGQGDTHAVVAAYAGDSAHAPSNSSPVNVTSSAVVLSTLSPTSAFVGTGTSTLSVSGANFNSGSAVQWNGSALATTFVSSSQLTATVPASLTDSAGSPNITVVFGQVASNAVAFSVVSPFSASPSPAALTVTAPGAGASAAITITPAAGFSGTVSFSCTVAYNGQGTPHDAPTCSVNPAQAVVASPSTASTTLSISSTAPHIAMVLPNAGGKQWVAFASSSSFGLAVVLVGVPWCNPSCRRMFRRIGSIPLLLAAFVGLLMLSACSGGGSNSGTNDPGSSTGSYTVTVNATAGAYTSSITVPVAVQ